jgi:hypothetical protein
LKPEEKRERKMAQVCCISFCLLVLLMVSLTGAFSPAEQSTRGASGRSTKLEASLSSQIERRRRLILQVPLTLTLLNAPPADAVMEKATNVFQAGKRLTFPEAEARFREGRRSLHYLLDHYDEICEGGGDNVRRYLGTVGTSSGLFGIGKVMRVLQERADDVVEYTETMNEVEKCIQQADGSSYMAIFVTTSSSSTPPSKYFADAKIEIERCVKAMDELAAMIDLKV